MAKITEEKTTTPSSEAEKVDTPPTTSIEGETTTSTRPAWADKYDLLAQKLPDGLSQRLPSSTQAQSAISTMSSTFGDKYEQLSQTSKNLSQTSKQRYIQLSKQAFTKAAWSITNESQVPVNVALGQVGPLMYQVLLPGETFARRTPQLWYWAEVVPWTSPQTEYNAWSAAWPILAVSGPSVALASLLAIPFVAVAAGGTALASLTSFGSSIVAGTTTAVSTTTSAVTSSTAAALSLATKASRIPGSGRVKTKLVDAAKKAVGARASDRNLQESVVRYIVEAAGGAGAAAAAGGKEKLQEIKDKKVDESEEAYLREREKKKEKKELDEVDVTGFEMDQVLKCETGDKKVDKALTKAFKKLSFKSTTYKTKNNPVLRLVGGPELETRESSQEPRQFLVFYPFALLPVPNATVEPVPLSEVPATLEEKELLRDARVVESFEEAEKVERKLREEGGLKRSDSRDETEVTKREEEERKAKLDKVVESVISEDEAAGEQSNSKEDATTPTHSNEKKKWWGWF